MDIHILMPPDCKNVCNIGRSSMSVAHNVGSLVSGFLRPEELSNI